MVDGTSSRSVSLAGRSVIIVAVQLYGICICIRHTGFSKVFLRLQVKTSQYFGDIYKVRIGFIEDDTVEEDWPLDKVDCPVINACKCEYMYTDVKYRYT
jgi:hypothetical protein